MNTRLVDFSGTLAFNRAYAVILALLFLAIACVAVFDDRARAVETAPSKAGQATGARGEACRRRRRRSTAAT